MADSVRHASSPCDSEDQLYDALLHVIRRGLAGKKGTPGDPERPA